MKELQSLIASIGADRVNDDVALCTLYSEDIAGPAAEKARAVVTPADINGVVDTLQWAHQNNCAVLARGGGMSYTSGYLPVNNRSVILDTTELSAVVRIDKTRHRVAVESGCTWSDLYDALKEAGLRTPFFGPLSGKNATVGGAVSQNGAFFGSARYGTVRGQIKGIELVDGCGRRRWFGEDIEGRVHGDPALIDGWLDLLTGDAGAFGIKTRIVLATIDYPHESHFASYVFDDSVQVIKAMHALSDVVQAADVYAFDRQTHINLASGGFSVLEAPTLAQDLLKQTGSVLKAAGAMLRGAALTKVRLAEHAWSLHVVADLDHTDDAEKVMAQCHQLCVAQGGRAIPDTIPRVTRARPFRTIKALVGPDGQRWLPCHGVFANAAAGRAIEKLDRWMQQRKDTLQNHGITITRLLARVGSKVIVEPQFFWPDELSAFQRAYATPEQVKQFQHTRSNREARQMVHQLRGELRDLFVELGAEFLQVGKYYPLSHKYGLVDRSQAQLLKSDCDPKGLLNPGP